jgi:hypothetical protein
VTSVIKDGATANSVDGDTVNQIDRRFPEHASDVPVKEAQFWLDDSWVAHPTYICSWSKLNVGRKERQQPRFRENLAAAVDYYYCGVNPRADFHHSDISTL